MHDWQSTFTSMYYSSIWTIFVSSLPTLGNGSAVGYIRWRLLNGVASAGLTPPNPLLPSSYQAVLQRPATSSQWFHYYNLNNLLALSLSPSKWSNFILILLLSLWLLAQHWLPRSTMSGKSIITVTLQLTNLPYQRHSELYVITRFQFTMASV